MNEQEILERLEEVGKTIAIGKLAGDVAHQVNNQLGGVLGFIQVVLMERDKDDPNYTDYKQIEASAKKCKELVSNLLEFSRDRKEEIRPLDINKVIEDALALIEHRLVTKNIKITCNLAPNLGQVQGDYYKLQQAFLAILSNARLAMTPKGGELTITTSAEDEKIVVKFTDTGCGISKENLGKVFEPFFASWARGEGIGLGLSIAKEIIAERKGSIEVKSEISKGTTFIIKLPV